MLKPIFNSPINGGTIIIANTYNCASNSAQEDELIRLRTENEYLKARLSDYSSTIAEKISMLDKLLNRYSL